MSNEGLDTEPPAWHPTAWHWAFGLSLLIHGLAVLLLVRYGGALEQRGEAAVLSVQLLAPTRALLAGADVATATDVNGLDEPLPTSAQPPPLPATKTSAPGQVATTASASADALTAAADSASAASSSTVKPASQGDSAASTTPTAAAPREAPVSVESAPLVSSSISSSQANADQPSPTTALAQTTRGERAALRQRADPPPARRLDYALSARSRGMNYQVTSTLTWARDGTHYRLENQGGAFLLGGFTFISQGEITAAGLAPERYEEHRKRRNVATNFSPARGEVSFSASEAKVPLTAGTQDRLSVLLQLAALARADPGQLTGPPFVEIPVAGSKGVDPWRFQALTLETLDTALGAVETIHLRRLPRRDDWDQQVDVWLAPTLDGLPVRIRLTEPNGDYVLQEITDADPPLGKAAPPGQTAN